MPGQPSILKVDLYSNQSTDLLHIIANYLPTLNDLFTLKVEGVDGRNGKTSLPHLSIDGHEYEGYQSIAMFIEGNVAPPQVTKRQSTPRDHMENILRQGDDDDGMGEGVDMGDIQARAAYATKAREKKFVGANGRNTKNKYDRMTDEPDGNLAPPDIRRGGARQGEDTNNATNPGMDAARARVRAGGIPPNRGAPPPPIMGRAAKLGDEERDLIRKNNAQVTMAPPRPTNIESDDDEDDILMKKMMGKINPTHETF
jgi:hypothetical protein